MTAERWQQIKDLFNTTLEREHDQWEEFLDDACRGDPSLRTEVESLLAAHEQALDFLEKPAAELLALSFPDGQSSLLEGKRVGPYRLQREIGRGGMGVVYLAGRDDRQYEKQVAVKLIKRGMDTDDMLRRFRFEMQTLATLDHPGIARLLDGGATEDGLPYFVMEYVEGLPIDDYCDLHKLNTSARLRLFREVCGAVHYAHQHLIVHRDLKPGHILVTADGTPKLLDFGIAKLLHQDSSAPALTRVGARLLTPEYASPEQVRHAPITTASDVYSLGVLLYKLLSGHRPYRFAGLSATEVERVICEQEPQRPSTAIQRVEETAGAAGKSSPEEISTVREGSLEKLHRRLAGDLDTIVLMALHKEPQRRYPSVEQFAEDIRRHLEGLPVIAHKDTLGYRSVKFVKRHKAGAAATALVLLSLLGAIIGISWQARIAMQERDKAEVEAAKALQINQFLQETLSAIDPEKSGEKDVTVAALLVEAAKRVDQELAAQPEVAAEVLTTIGTTYQNLGQYEQAGLALQRALELRRRLFGDKHAEVARSIKNVALVRHYQGDLKYAAELYQQAIALYRKLNVQGTRDFAEALNDYGILLNETGKYEQAKAVYRESLAMDVRLVGNDHEDVASVYNNLALTLHEEGKLDSAEILYRKALAIFDKIHGEEHPQTVRTLNNLAFVLNDKGERDAAARSFQRSLEIRRKLLGNEHPDVLTAVHNLAAILYYQEKYVQAEQMIREAISIGEKILPPIHPSLANSLFWQGRILIALDEPKKAEQSLRRSLKIRQAVFEKGHAAIAKAHIELGKSLVLQRRFREAEQLLQNGCRALKSATGDQSQGLQECRQTFRDLYKAMGKPEKAVEYEELTEK